MLPDAALLWPLHLSSLFTADRHTASGDVAGEGRGRAQELRRPEPQRQRPEAFVSEQFAPDITLHPGADFADSQIRHGRDEVLLLYMELREAWERVEFETEKLVDAGDYVVASVLARGVLKGTEDELEMRLVITYVVRGGRIAEIRVFRNFAEALNAAGLQE